MNNRIKMNLPLYIITALILAAFLVPLTSCRAKEKEEAKKDPASVKTVNNINEAENAPQKAELPDMPDTIGKFKLKDKTAVYTPDELYEPINGEAALYQEYNIRGMSISFYTDGENEIEVITADMGTPLNAFGVLSRYSGEWGKIIKLGARGYKEDKSVSFYLGKLFFQAALIKGSAKDAPLEISKELAKLSDAKPSLPKEIEVFPKEGLLDYSIKYTPANFMGLDVQEKTFEASYKNGETPLKTFVIFTGDEKKVEGLVKKISSSEEGIMVKAKGSNIAGVREVKNKAEADELIRKILENIQNIED